MLNDIVSEVMKQKVTSTYLHVGVSRIKKNTQIEDKEWQDNTMTIF